MRELIFGLLDALALGPLVVNATWLGTLEDVLLPGWHVCEDFRCEMEVFRDYRSRGMRW